MRVKDLMLSLTQQFQSVGIENPTADARALIAFAIKKEPIFLRMNPDFFVENDEMKTLESFVGRRLNREPVSKIIATRGFWCLDFKVTKDVLDPRPDSEVLIETVLEYYKDKSLPLKILDLGTGSGCLALSLLCEYINAKAIGFDFSEKALKIASENAEINGLSKRFQTMQGDWNQINWNEIFNEMFDVVISNPPYIAESERPTLSPEVLNFDPEMALFADENGLQAYMRISEKLPELLSENGLFVCEFGQHQETSVRDIICQNQMEFRSFGVDLGGITRCLSVIYRKTS